MNIKLIKLLSFFLFICLTLPFSTAFSDDDSYTGKIPPVEIGSPCSSGDTNYHWVTRQRTAWSLMELFATPTSISKVEDWPQMESFRLAMQQHLNGSTDVVAFASACRTISPDFVDGSAKVFVKIVRQNSIAHSRVSCENEQWTVSTDSVDSSYDESEFLLLGNSDGYALQTITDEELASLLSSFLDLFNQQPGADTRPNHEYWEE